jgi:putative methionine-R-sulfoxide reductase with GAF domain
VSGRSDAYRGVVDAVDRMVNRGDEADQVVRATVELLAGRLPRVEWAGISFVEGGELAPGPTSGVEATGSRLAVPIEYEGRTVGELAVASSDPEVFDDEDASSLERVATLISQHTLVAWDTAGEAWSP